MPTTQSWLNVAEAASPQAALAELGLTQFAHLIPDTFPHDLDADRLTSLHRQLRDEALSRADAAFAALLVWLMAATNLDALASRAFRDTTEGRWVNQGLRDVTVTLPGGLEAPLHLTYLLDTPARHTGRSKRHGNRGPTGAGVYPALEALGIDSHRRFAPLSEELICKTAAACDNFQTGCEMAQEMGLEMSEKTYHERFTRISQALQQQTEEGFEQGRGPALYEPERWAGQRLQISLDGGRTRLRENHSGSPRQSGYHGFEAEWREPKLFTIHALDEEGKPLEELEPILDGTFGDADACVARLARTLEAIGVEHAREVVVLGDGAHWIWRRMRPMLLEQGLKSEQITEGIDWYHAKSTVVKLSDLPDTWSNPKRISWKKRAIDALYKGEVLKVVEMIEELSRAPGASKAKEKIAYFKANAERMRYDELRARKFPQGSGAVESAVRRVVNLRLKGNSKYWLEENAEAMLTLRGAFKSGRFERLMSWSRRFRAHFWTPSDQRQLRCHRTQTERLAA